MQRQMCLALALALALTFLAAAVRADTFVGTSNGLWQPLITVSLNEKTPPFWDNTSWDGSQQNVGYKLQSYQPLSYWSINGGVDPNVSFKNTNNNPESVMLLIEIAGNKDINQLYVYDIAHPTTQQIPVFKGTDSTGSPVSVTVNIPTSWSGYGFLLKGAGNTNFYSTSSVAGATSDGNFAFFAPTGTFTSDGSGQYSGNVWYVAVEDLSLGSSDKDYNDMVFKITNVSAPVPPSALLLVTGLLGLGAVGWRRTEKS
jgi:Domain of unknown function (DUF4114)